MKFERCFQFGFQFGFRKDHSAAMALVCLIDKISQALENGEYVLGLFLDFSKAFDTINFDIMLLKLSYYGVRGCVLDWFRSNLSDRYQYVSYNGYNSVLKPVVCGVPQGSILGPLLFLIYINDLESVSDVILKIMFADDTNMFMTGKDLNSLEIVFNTELEKINEWIQTNKLSLNLSKTHFMLFKGRKKVSVTPSIVIANTSISQMSQTKFLGIMLDDRISWVPHIDDIAKKLSKSIGILSRLKRYLNKESLINMYYAFVYPYFHYCNEVWGNAYASHLKRLFLLQKRAIRIICQSEYRAHTSVLFTQCKILKLPLINDYLTAQFMYRFYNDKLPDVFVGMFKLNSSVHGYNTRQQDCYHVPKVKSNFMKRTISYRGVVLWNSLSKNINCNYGFYTFKSHVKNLLIEQL